MSERGSLNTKNRAYFTRMFIYLLLGQSMIYDLSKVEADCTFCLKIQLASFYNPINLSEALSIIYIISMVKGCK